MCHASESHRVLYIVLCSGGFKCPLCVVVHRRLCDFIDRAAVRTSPCRHDVPQVVALDPACLTTSIDLQSPGLAITFAHSTQRPLVQHFASSSDTVWYRRAFPHEHNLLRHELSLVLQFPVAVESGCQKLCDLGGGRSLRFRQP